MRNILVLLLLPVLLAGALLWGQEGPALEALADQVLTVVSELRSLELLRDVRKGVMSRQEIESVFRKRVEEDYSPADLEKERKLLVKLGVLPPEYDYVNGTMRVLNEQVAGYYDPRDKTLFIADWLPPETQQMTMAHELAHALQDQHYDLEKILSGSDGNADALMARRAVVEGDAVGVMFDYLLRPMGSSFVALPNLKDLYQQTLEQQLSGQQGTQELQEAPAFIRDSLLFSYVYGARFMQVYRESHAWAETGSLYGELPKSTEQIMHPEKYLAERDDPTRLDEAIVPQLGAWEIEYSDIFGEFQVYLVLRQFLSDEEALAAASGWDGDQIRLLRDEEGRLAVQWDSIWDSAEEARQFRDSYSNLIRLKYQQGFPQEDGAGNLVWESDFDQIRIHLDDRAVRILEIERVPVVRG